MVLIIYINFERKNLFSVLKQIMMQTWLYSGSKMQSDTNDWYENIKKHSQRKRLPILLPSKKIISRTLYFEKDSAMRSEDYMERILKKYPTFIWLSDQILTEE